MCIVLLVQVLPGTFTTIALSAVLFYLNHVLLLTCLVVAPVMILFGRIIGTRVRRHASAYHRSFAHLSANILFVLRMIDLIRMQTAEDFEFRRQTAAVEGARRSSTILVSLQWTFAAVQNVMVAFIGLIILLVGGHAVMVGDMSTGELLSFYVMTALLRNNLNFVSWAMPVIVAGQESLNTLFRLSQESVSLPYSGTREITFSGLTVFENVTFSYGDAPVIRDVSLTLQPGSIVSIVGPNGSGKSTIINLILGFYRPDHGVIRVDGNALEVVDLNCLRR